MHQERLGTTGLYEHSLCYVSCYIDHKILSRVNGNAAINGRGGGERNHKRLRSTAFCTP